MRLAFHRGECSSWRSVASAVTVLMAQDGVYETLSVESTSSDAMDVAGGIELGVDLSAENGGVPETAIILVNGPTCPAPLSRDRYDDSGAWEPQHVPVCA